MVWSTGQVRIWVGTPRPVGVKLILLDVMLSVMGQQ